MTHEVPAVLPLAQVGGSDRASAGGKAAMLGELRRRGFEVPDGVVLTLVHKVPAGPAPLTETVDEAVLDELDDARTRLGGRVAVRSSAPDEDGTGRSAAGRYVTVLDVADRAGLAAAVRECRASAGSSGAPIAVLVQRMVSADSAGVAFTADPVTGERDLVVIVAGEPGSVTDGGAGRQWRLRGCAGARAAAELDGPAARRLRCRDAPVRPVPRHPSALPDGPLDPPISSPTSLDGAFKPGPDPAPATIREIARIAAAAAEVVGGPTDLEWAVRDGKVHVLQARPMTGLPDPVRWRSPLPGGWLRNFRIGEWLPGPVTPLFESWFVTAVEDGVRRRAAREAGLVMRAPLHVVVHGWYFHAPVGIAPIRALLGVLPRRPDFALGAALVRFRPEWTERLVVRRRFTARWAGEVRPAYDAACDRLAGAVASDPDPAALVEEIDRIADAVAAVVWSLSMVGGFAWKVEAVLAQLLARSIPAVAAVEIAAWLAQPPARAPIAGPPAAVPSLDWYHPVADLRGPAAVPPRRTGPDIDGARTVAGRWRWRRVERLAALAARYSGLREEQAADLPRPWPALRAAVARLGVAAAASGALADPDDVWFLRRDELFGALGGASAAPPDLPARRARWLAGHRLTPPLQLGRLPGPVRGLLPRPAGPVHGALVAGQPASPGRACGAVLVAADLAQAQRLTDGQVLVAPLVTPAWLPVLARAAAVVVDGGTVAAHAAVVCRELGVPMVVATGDATVRLVSGETVVVDGGEGTVRATAPAA